MNIKIKPRSNIQKTIRVPGDKSISHRAVMFGALAKGTTTITNFLDGADCLSTVACFNKLGVETQIDGKNVFVRGKGLRGLSAYTDYLDVGNSGTTMRLITGILAAQRFNSQLTGDASIQKRPMKRVFEPLEKMGAKFESDGYAPYKIIGSQLHGIDFEMKVASAQLKSAIILAGLYAEGLTAVTEPAKSRDHTEIMLKNFGADICCHGNKITVKKTNELFAAEVAVPSDISSAMFFIVAALITKNSEITLTNVGLNPTRTGALEILVNMGADIEITSKKSKGGELTGDICARYSKLKGVQIGGDIIPRLLDELPVLAVAAMFAEGQTIIKDARELKIKESNRIKSVVEEGSKIGADIMETDDGMIINGKEMLEGGAALESYMDHRIAMSFAVASLACKNANTIIGAECVDISFPGFYDMLGE